MIQPSAYDRWAVEAHAAHYPTCASCGEPMHPDYALDHERCSWCANLWTDLPGADPVRYLGESPDD